MFRKPTLFVIGAGASCEARLPTGDALRKTIASHIDIRFSDGYRQDSGNHKITSALRQLNRDISPFLSTAWQLRDALPLAISIDNLIDGHRGNDAVQICGKLGIASAILEAEQNSSLYISRRNSSTLDYGSLQNSWYGAFIQLITQDVAKNEIESIFDNVAIICFNYDRCIEHFLSHALSTYYALPLHEATAVVSKLKIIHPYGKVGRLPWQAGAGGAVEFGADNVDLLSVSKALKTFTEQIEDKVALVSMQNFVEVAETVVFLGFAFHQQNMRLLKLNKPSNAKFVAATTLGISPQDVDVVRAQTNETLGRSIDLRAHDGTCSSFFKAYWRTLSAA